MSATGHDRTTSPAHAATTPSPLAGASPRHARVAFVGAGPGDPGLLTIRGASCWPPPTPSSSTPACRATSSPPTSATT